MPDTADAGLLSLRLALGAVVTAHGLAKLTARFGGAGLDRTAAELGAEGLSGGRRTAGLAGGCQLAGGVATALGALFPLAAATVLGVMVVAVATVRHTGFWARSGGYEYALCLAVMAAALGLTGPGDASLDHLAGFRDPPGAMRAGVVVAAAAVGLASFRWLSRNRSQLV